MHAIQGVPARAPRKAAHSHRSPSYDDPQPGHFFSLPFGSLRSHSPDTKKPSSPSIEAWEAHRTDALCPDKATATSRDSDLMIHTVTANHTKENNYEHSPSRASANERSVSSSRAPTLPFSSSSRTSSLADQYLDTMIPDDFWRALCRRKIRQKQRKLQELQRSNAGSNATFDLKAIHPHRKWKSKHFAKRRSCAPVISKDRLSRKSDSPGGSDSGFISSSPPPSVPRLRVRPTHNCPVQSFIPTMSIDTSISMTGRSCLACGCTNTTCWRRTLGGIICNSCGLR